MRNNLPYQDITRTILAVLGIGALIIAAYWIVKPFMLSMLWAGMIVVSTWQLLLRMEKLLWGKRSLAAVVMALLLALLFIVPLITALGLMMAYADRIAGWIETLSIVLPPPPQWLDTLPFFGFKLANMWRDVASAGTSGLSARIAPHADEIAAWLLREAGNQKNTIFDFFLTVIISAVLYAKGETASQGLLRFARRLAGARGEEVTILAAKAVRGVALGVVVTALAQSIAGGIGLAVSGVPAAAFLGFVMFVLCLAQLGPSPVLVPAVIWLFWSDSTGWGIFLGLWAVPVILVDNYLRPMLIRKTVDIPLLLVFPGVIGGLITLGIIGVFVGPVVLVVTYSLLATWIKDGEKLDERLEKAQEKKPEDKDAG